jgi:hypothetical protein
MVKRIGLNLILMLSICFAFPSDLSSQTYSEALKLNALFNRTAWEVNHDLFIIHAIPKCGTHYIQRTIHLMTNQVIINRNINIPKLEEACLNNQILRSFQPYHTDLFNTLKDANHKVISMIRDPRDALISHVFYMRNFPKNPNGDNNKRDFFTVGPDFDNLSLEDQITALIVGNEHAQSYIDFYKQRIGWALNPKVLTIKYEDLLGKAGGGNEKIKRAKVLEMAHFIRLNLNDEQFEKVIEQMYVDFGNDNADGKVFERSTTGNWRTFLNHEHVKLLKKKLGKELISLGYEKDYKW